MLEGRLPKSDTLTLDISFVYLVCWLTMNKVNINEVKI